MHEAKMHEASCFLTLTYSDENLPEFKSLSKVDCQLFLKRLRERVSPAKIRFFLSGEYGEDFARPHYHALIFGYDFPDRVKVADHKGLFVSPELEKLWSKGHCMIGAVSFQSAAYVAQYAMKKVSGPGASKWYGSRIPEFLLMSRRPGIGNAWIKKFGTDVFPSDEVIVNGRQTRPPRYYDSVWAVDHPEDVADVKAKREVEAEKLEDHRLSGGQVVKVGPSRNAVRLAVRERVAEAKIQLKGRKL